MKLRDPYRQLFLSEISPPTQAVLLDKLVCPSPIPAVREGVSGNVGRAVQTTPDNGNQVVKDYLAASPRIVPAIFPYRPLSADLTDTNPTCNTVKGFEATSRGLTPDYQILTALTLFYHNPEFHDILDLLLICSAFKYSKISGIPVSVNATGRLLNHAGIWASIVDSIFSTKLVPQNVTLEVVETTELTTAAIENLRVLAGLGVKISIDDFGLERSIDIYKELKWERIPISEIKFDGITTMSDTRFDEAEKFFADRYATVQRIVWEGHPKGVARSMIDKIAAYHSRQKHSGYEILFEGSILSA